MTLGPGQAVEMPGTALDPVRRSVTPICSFCHRARKA